MHRADRTSRVIDAERLGEIDRLLAGAVKPARWPLTVPLEITANHLPGEPVPHAQAMAGPWEPFEVGDRWGSDWGTTWFHLAGTIPQAWAGNEVVIVVDLGYSGGTGFGAEGQVWVDGRPARGISPNHREIPVGAPAVGGEVIDLHIEAAANPPTPPADPAPLLLPDPDGPPGLVLRRCHLAVVDRAVEALVRDWLLVRELGTWLGEETRDRAGRALDDAARVVEAGGVDAARVVEARRCLAPVLERRGDDARFTHLAAGNSHLDTAWLWPLRESRRKAARTFSTAVTMLDEHPDYRFSASQAQHFAWIRDDHPGLYERIRAHVADGRFDLVGSMWVETDCNIPSGESLVRQIVHGRRFFRDEFGVDTPGVWLPDTFGYSAAMPQILRRAGIDWFMTQKLSWNDTNRFPHHTFRWEGIDGSRVFCHLPPADTYNGDLSVANLRHAEQNFSEAAVRSQTLYLYGHGDGGGGPDLDMLERARRLADLDGLGRVELTTASAAMERLRAEGDDDDLPVWTGELYLELHRGTFTTHAAVKQANRRLEGALREAELWTVAARQLTGRPVPSEPLDDAWKTVLLHQFHDIIPGSSIHWVYADTHADHRRVAERLDAVIDGALTAIGAAVDLGEATEPVLVTNSLPFERNELVDHDGRLVAVSAPPCGWTVIDGAAPARLDGAPVTAGDHWFANGLLRVEWDDDGLLTSVRHLATGRDAVAAGARANVLQLLEDRPEHWDAWDIDRAAFATATDIVELDALEVIEAGPDRATLRVVRHFGASRIEQRHTLLRGSGRLDVESVVDWHEDHKLLKVAFPIGVECDTATHEIQYGHVERPTRADTSWEEARYETCAHTWVDLSDDSFGVALLNDCKYGHDVDGGMLRLSLLRAPTWPDPVADRGRHRFGYALFPHAGGPTTGGVIAEAHAFNTPLRLHPIEVSRPVDASTATSPSPHSVVRVDDPGVVVAAVKQADDGDATVVRLYESFGRTGRVSLTVPGVGAAVPVDLFEQPAGAPLRVVDDTVGFELGPFELLTLRLEMTAPEAEPREA